MMSTRDHMIKTLYMINDLVCVVAAWLCAYALRFYGPFEVWKGIPKGPVYFKLVPFILIVWLSVLTAGGLYRYLQRSRFFEAVEVFKLCFLSLIVFIVLTYFYEEYRYSRLTLVFFAILHPTFVLLGRSALRKILRFYRKKQPPRQSMLIGSGPALDKAFEVAQTLDLVSLKYLGLVGVGNLDDAKHKAKEIGCPYFDIPQDWISFFQSHPCETLIIALPLNGGQDFLSTHLEALIEQVPDIKILPDLSYLERFNAGTEWIRNAPVVNVHDSPLKGFAQVEKRIFDFLVALICIIVFSPLLILISILVKLSSPGPVFYSQERMGLDGRIFSILKFRSMPQNIEKTSGAVWAKKDDGRVTRIGNLLRKSSLDELPQLFNVLRGDMSLVGPRPERPVFVSQFRRSVPGYMLRHKVKAGMTGWAQVNGWRGNTSIERRIESDLYYIQNWSLWLDIKIMLLTVVKGFINTNAY